MIDKNQDKIQALLAQLDDDSETQIGGAAALSAAAQLLEGAVDISLRINQPERFAALKSEDLPPLVSIMSETVGKLFDLYRSTMKHLPPEAVEGLLVKLKVSKSLLTAELETNAKEIQLYANEIAEIQKQKLEKEDELKNRITEVDRMFQRVKILEDTLRTYAESSHRALNSLPRRLNEAIAKLEAVEKMLGEVDDDMRKLIEEHEHGSNVMQKIEV